MHARHHRPASRGRYFGAWITPDIWSPSHKLPTGIELRHLRAFVAVAEELSFGRAADRLYISQSALSRQIRGLEQLLGCELLRRSTHRVELTIAGEALLDRSHKILRDVDEAVSATLAVGGELLSRITKLWEPMAGLLAPEADLQEARAAGEELLAQTSTPLGTRVRPVTAGGVSSLLVSPSEDTAATVLYLHGGGYVFGSAFRVPATRGRDRDRGTDRRPPSRLPPRSRAPVSRSPR